MPYAVRMKRWTVATIVVACGLFAFAVSRGVYEATSPTSLAWHVALRKTYSIVAFGLIAYCLYHALGEYGVAGGRAFATCVVGLAAFSAAVEIGQVFAGSTEGLGWNAFDVACGGAGGALGGAVAAATRRTRGSPPR